MKLVVNFKFKLKQKVETCFGDVGIIEVAAIDDGGIKYYVKRSQEDKWFSEDQLLVKYTS